MEYRVTYPRRPRKFETTVERLMSKINMVISMIPGDELMLPSDVLLAVYSKILPNSDSNKLFLNAFFRAETFEYACQRNFWGEILLYCDGGRG